MPGKATKSKKRKELAGTKKSGRDNEVLPPPEVVPSFPDPPENFTEIGVKAYWDLVKHVRAVDALWSIDTHIIEHGAYWMQLFRQAQDDVLKQGMVQTFATGARQISPEVQILNMAEKNVQTYFDLLGIGPKSREGIGVFQVSGGGDETKDPFTMLLNQLREDGVEDAEIVK